MSRKISVIGEPTFTLVDRKRREAVRELSQLDPEILAHRERLKVMPLQQIFMALVDQGFWDDLRIDD